MSGEQLEDFEALLDTDFSAIQFSNDLLKATNGGPSTAELDLGTSIKKINYDIGEINLRIDDTIKTNHNGLMDEVFRVKSLQKTTAAGLKPSLEYLDMSYQRLQNEVLEPHSKAQKLQNVLSKVHQTSSLLRDALVYIHLVSRMQSLLEEQTTLTTERSLQLASIHTQLRLNMEKNANLTSLRLIKKLEAEVALPNKKEVLNFIAVTLSKQCTNYDKSRDNTETVAKLMKSLYGLSKQEYVSTIHKIVLTSIALSAQTLAKTLNSIKTFPTAFEEVVSRGSIIYQLEEIMRKEKVEKFNLLNEFMSQMRPKPLSPTKLFWSRIASNFKKEFDLSYTRGGPVGKSLSRHETMIADTIKQAMSNNAAINSYLDMMLASVSILQND
ncbi:hypothetical protein HG535_0D02300 [Zygotorulaspora mrakii]|uniref:Conserved oligomeric Golgi complex subunit 5 n=1 Tax=Zygotorulaspora mrakii TaxID=42260 RepID=A0A7H9B442_ZYGMR|nr:uncharacterized protein HG535_0D02300 [Zygotorulaspora mrakii]QLG72522.1 hypothetical protein HG535_0D02300 [Zygotorulaspora mrakii]